MSFINNALKKIKLFFQGVKKSYSFNFLNEMETAFPNSVNKSTAALRYLKKIQKDKNYSENPNGIKGGNLYWFKYQDPLTKETLPYWDLEPLVIMSSTFDNSKGQKRVLGLNMHLLPPHIRVLVFNEIYEAHKSSFKKKLTDKEHSFEFLWRNMYTRLRKYGGSFAIRMYAPSQIKALKKFPLEEWSKAVYIPSRRYVGTNLVQLEKEWKAHMRRKN